MAPKISTAILALGVASSFFLLIGEAGLLKHMLIATK